MLSKYLFKSGKRDNNIRTRKLGINTFFNIWFWRVHADFTH